MGDEPGRGWGDIHRERKGEGRVCSREREEMGVRFVNIATVPDIISPSPRGGASFHGVERDNV